jgi:hypothetical protein
MRLRGQPEKAQATHTGEKRHVCEQPQQQQQHAQQQHAQQQQQQAPPPAAYGMMPSAVLHQWLHQQMIYTLVAQQLATAAPAARAAGLLRLRSDVNGVPAAERNYSWHQALCFRLWRCVFVCGHGQWGQSVALCFLFFCLLASLCGQAQQQGHQGH